ncbi:MAG: replicative DNA helicase [Planctomycetes bacterium]|nr:replicative DNA helicase [Planctomycetota bacterium]
MAKQEPIDRVPPHNEEAEICVLGSMLLDNQCISDVLHVLGERGHEHFYSAAHQSIYRTGVEIYDNKQALDLVLLQEELEKRDLLNKIGGIEYLTRVLESVPSAANADHYAEIVREKAVLRSLVSVSNSIQRMAYENTEDSSSVLDKAESLIFNVTQTGLTRDAISIDDLMRQTFDRIDQLQGGGMTGIPTGFTDLDNKITGLKNAEFIILAARPSVGKTALCLNIAEHVALTEKLPVALFSMEMSSVEIGLRLLCAHAKVDAHIMRTGTLPAEGWSALNLAVGDLSQAPMFVDDTPGLSTLELRAKARRLKAQHDICLIIVDYLQLMESGRMDGRQQEISEISRGLKALARELNIPVLALSQLNRGPEQGDGREPRLSDLRESGSLEQDADVVILLHRKILQEDDASIQAPQRGPTDKVTDVIVAKQRNGPTGKIKLTFLPQFVRFESHAGIEAPGMEESEPF